MSKLLIHIGYHKTGTKWLQKELFVPENNVFEPIDNINGGPSRLANLLIVGEDGYMLSPFESSIKNVRRRILHCIALKKRLLNDKTFVMSSERLSGNPHHGGFDSKVIASRLKACFPQAQILIVIREQKSFLMSNYFQYLSRGGTQSIKKYLNTMYDRRQPMFSPHYIDYFPLISEYYKLFDKRNVKVLPYEMFKTEPVKFIDEIGDFVGEKIQIDKDRFQKYHNRKYGKYVMYYFRFLNYFIYKNTFNKFSIFHNRIFASLARFLKSVLMVVIPQRSDLIITDKISEYIRSWENNRYSESNRKVSELIEIDLSKYGYA